MSIRATFSSSFKMIGASLVLCCRHPYLFLYKLIPIAAPVILMFVADEHRMFDLALHHRPIMSSVFYALIGLNILFTVYLARRALYLMYKKQNRLAVTNAEPTNNAQAIDLHTNPRPWLGISPNLCFVRHSQVLVHAITWAAVIIAGMFAFSRMTQWVYLSIKNPMITKYGESYTTLITQGVPSLLLLLTFLWSFTLLVPAIIATEPMSLYAAIRRSCSLIAKHFWVFLVIWFVFSCLDLIPIAVPLAIPRQYPMVKQILPYCVQLVIATLHTVTYCVFYSTYKSDPHN